MKYKIYQNGKESTDQQKLAFFCEESAGIFESMRVYDGKILHLDEHLRRLLGSAKTVGYKPLPDLKMLRCELAFAMKASGETDTSIRLTLWEGGVFVILGTRVCPAEFYKKGVVLKTSSFPRGNANAFPYQAKASAYQQAVLASTEPHPNGVFDWIFLDQGNYLTETRVGNFFIVKYLCTDRVCAVTHTRSVQRGGAVLLTPPEHLILNGVTRRFVIKCALEIGFQVQEIPLTRHDFFNADEAFLSNTSWEILPVRELDGRLIGAGTPGPVTQKLHRFLKRRIHQDVASNHSPGTHQRFR